jgi:hypothetical protein
MNHLHGHPVQKQVANTLPEKLNGIPYLTGKVRLCLVQPITSVTRTGISHQQGRIITTIVLRYLIQPTLMSLVITSQHVSPRPANFISPFKMDYSVSLQR